MNKSTLLKYYFPRNLRGLVPDNWNEIKNKILQLIRNNKLSPIEIMIAYNNTVLAVLK